MVADVPHAEAEREPQVDDGVGAPGGGEPTQVRVFSASDPGRPFDVVGLVVSQQDTSDPRELMLEVRRLAAAMGADAVVDLRLTLGFGVWNVGHHVTGTAVRYR